MIPRANARRVLDRLGSDRKELVTWSYHVVTLDHDAPLVRQRVRSFAPDLDARRTPS